MAASRPSKPSTSLHDETLQGSTRASFDELPSTVPALTVLYHRDPERVGQVGWLASLLDGTTVSVSRLEPFFAHPTGLAGGPLADPFVSRDPLTLTLAGGVVTLARGARDLAVAVDGVTLEDRIEVPVADLEGGVVLELGRPGVVLLLHLMPFLVERPPPLGLVGDNPAMARLRVEILRVAVRPTSVLIRGETGAGKELVARAIHDASPRRGCPCVSVNMATVPDGLAASTLFGHVAQAFTDAKRDRRGYFERADGGTLFLDEVGETPRSIQAMLLRTLETGEIEPVGAEKARRVDVRVLAATDAHLERAIAEGRFSEALLHRLSGYQLELPPLRQRRDDIARLLFHFLRQELEAFDEVALLSPEPGRSRPWLPPSLVARLARYDWPGNVRQLRNVAHQIVVSSRGDKEARLPAVLERQIAPAPRSSAPPAAVPERPSSEPTEEKRRKPSEITDEELIEALRQNRWRRDATADQLGVSRSALYERMDRCPRIRKVHEVPAEEIRRCWRECDGDLERMSVRLEVSVKGLKLRLNTIDLG